tara:strand:- start:776 stop:1420 length:645 start_codon:yes stop_codon:yes gene_type:complete
MKVKIKKKGKTKKYNVISSWSEVTLEKWIKLAELQGLSNSEEALETIKIMSDIPEKLIKQLSIPALSVILNRLSQLQAERKVNLQKIIKVDDKEYGFHPNLSEDLTLGEWADIEHFIKEGVENNLPQLMAILYREIVEREGEAYIIKAYDGNIDVRAEKFKKMKAEQIESALMFFFAFVKEFLRILPSSLMDHTKEMIKLTQTKHLQKSGATLD